MATKMTALYKKELLERVIMTLLRSPHSRIYRADGPAEPKTFATIVEEDWNIQNLQITIKWRRGRRSRNENSQERFRQLV
jgi:hypothetical protein